MVEPALAIRTATAADAEWVSQNLSKADRTEIQTAVKRIPMLVAYRLFQTSTACFSATRENDKNPSALFGVVVDEEKDSYGIAWLAVTDAFSVAALEVQADFVSLLDDLARPFPNGLHTLVDARNTLHRDLFRLYGFTGDEMYELGGMPFHYLKRSA